MLIGESNVAIDPAIGGYGVADVYLGEFSPQKEQEFLEWGAGVVLLLGC